MKKKNVKDLEEIYWLVVGIGIILSLMNIFLSIFCIYLRFLWQ